jgi:AcrR family transcriptional regulator
VLKAAYEVVAERGYEGFTIEAVAECSGVHKTTIYRRWSTIEDVLLDAVVARAEQAVPLLRTDDARADLVAMGRAVASNLADPMSQAVAAAALSGPADGQLSELSKRFWALRLAEASVIVEDAQQQGSIDTSLDPAEVVERIVGPIWFRSMVLGQGVDDGFVEMLVYSVA